MVEGNVDTQQDRHIGPDFWAKALRDGLVFLAGS